MIVVPTAQHFAKFRPAQEGGRRRVSGNKTLSIIPDDPYLLEVRTRADVPMPRTGYWDIAGFLRVGNEQ